MKYNELNAPSNKNKTRVGRGISAGKGKTAGRGTKGQNARTGGGVRLGFEGGQNPLNQRMPKLRGFTSHRTKTIEVQLSELPTNKTVVDNHSIFEAGLAPTAFEKVKVIAGGDLKKALTVKLQGASASSIKAIEKAGGKFEKTTTPQRKPKSTKKD